jgi:tripeptide aminopeptidase
MNSALVDLFLDAVKVDAQSLHEKPMADFVRSRLASYPVRVTEDAAASAIGGDSGNLICVPKFFDPSRPATALIAHLDTPRSTAAVRPQVSGGRITSDGTTALGVDNRAGVSILLNWLFENSAAESARNSVVAFTVAEELGMYGAMRLDLSPFNVTKAYVFDCSKRPGTFIRSAVGSSLFTAAFVGRSSHAGVSPEKGINAIQLASHALSKVQVGRLSPTMTSNFGIISGGEATNVVPARVTVEGEVREFDQRLINEYLRTVESRLRASVESQGGTLEFSSQVDFPPFILDEQSEVYRHFVEVVRDAGLQPNAIEYLGGSDANVLNARGLPTVNLGIGAQNPHGNDEFILIEDLEKSYEIALGLSNRVAVERS